MNKVISVFLITIAMCGTTSFGAVTAVLRFHPDSVLPGLPVGIQILITNASQAAVTIPNGVTFRVTPPTGDLHQVISDLPSDLPVVRLEPGQSRSVFYDYGATLFEGALLPSQAMVAPGTYMVKAVLGDGTVTSGASITVLSPQGPDVQAWHRLVELNGGRGPDAVDFYNVAQPFSKFLNTEIPDSQYRQYFEFYSPAPGTQIDKMIATSVVTKDPVLRDTYRLTSAGMLHNQSMGAASRGNEELAVALSDRARPLLESVKNESKIVNFVDEAAALSSQLLDRKSAHAIVMRFIETQEKTAPVTPFVDCVKHFDWQRV